MKGTGIIPIFDMTTSMRVETLASDVFGTLLDQLKKAEVMFLSVDGSTDSSNVAQLSCFREELLGLIPMDGHTTIEILLEKVITFFRENQLEMDCVNMLVMNSAPAMSGRTQGLSARLADVVPQLRSLHCLPH